MWRIGFGVILFISFSLTTVNSSQNVDVQGEINRIADRLSKFEKPNPVMVGSFIQQIQTYCPNKTIDENVIATMSTCMESKFNNTALEEDIREAIPQGKLDEVFHDICKKWPIMKDCLKPLIDTVQDCWAKGDKLTRVMDNMVLFFCGNDNDGARIALFFADGGMQCVEKYGEDIKACIGETQTTSLDELDPLTTTEDDLCRSIKQLHECTFNGLSKCADSTPQNLVTSMLKSVAKAIDCPAIPDPVRLTSDATTSHISSSSYQFILLSAVLAFGIRLYSSFASL